MSYHLFILQINRIVIELYLRYHSSYVSSTSDFWWDGQRKVNFGAAIANMMADHYRFHNGMFLAVSSTTMKEMMIAKTTGLLCSVDPKVARLQALLDFSHFDSPKTGENIGHWLGDIHHGVGCKPEFISHTVDGASNAGSSEFSSSRPVFP